MVLTSLCLDFPNQSTQNRKNVAYGEDVSRSNGKYSLLRLNKCHSDRAWISVVLTFYEKFVFNITPDKRQTGMERVGCTEEDVHQCIPTFVSQHQFRCRTIGCCNQLIFIQTINVTINVKKIYLVVFEDECEHVFNESIYLTKHSQGKRNMKMCSTFFVDYFIYTSLFFSISTFLHLTIITLHFLTLLSLIQQRGKRYFPRF